MTISQIFRLGVTIFQKQYQSYPIFIFLYHSSIFYVVRYICPYLDNWNDHKVFDE